MRSKYSAVVAVAFMAAAFSYGAVEGAEEAPSKETNYKEACLKIEGMT